MKPKHPKYWQQLDLLDECSLPLESQKVFPLELLEKSINPNLPKGVAIRVTTPQGTRDINDSAWAKLLARNKELDFKVSFTEEEFDRLYLCNFSSTEEEFKREYLCEFSQTGFDS